MSDTVATVITILLVLAGSAVFLILCVIASAYTVGYASETYDKHQKRQAERPTLTICELHGCPVGRDEHVCKRDPIDEVALHHIESYAWATDPKWYTRMAGRESSM